MIESSSFSCVGNRIHTSTDVEAVLSIRNSKVYTSNLFHTPVPFSRLMISANFTSQSGSLLVEIQIFTGGKWSKFYKMGLIASTLLQSYSLQEDENAKVQIDELVLKNEAQAYRWRLTVENDGKINNLSVSWVATTHQKENLARKYTCELVQPFPLKVPISQMEINLPDCKRICSPTSLCMALNSLGVSVNLDEVMRGVYDSRAKIYGNWFFSIAYSGRLGIKSYFWRMESSSQLETFLREKNLVVASIAYNKNELTLAPLESTAGHLVLILGLYKDKIIVADPAASKKENVLINYDIKQFERCWLQRKNGACYIVRNYEKNN